MVQGALQQLEVARLERVDYRRTGRYPATKLGLNFMFSVKPLR
jgi:hypothetical protein